MRELKKIKTNVPAKYEQVEVQKHPPQQSDISAILQDLPKDIQEYVMEQVNGSLQKNIPQFQAQSMEEIMKEFEELEQQLDSKLKQEQEDQQKQASDAQNAPPQEQQEESGTKSCSAEERAFLDEFIELQMAGSLLGMIPSSSIISDSHIHNTRLVPVQDSLQHSDKQYLVEIRDNKALFDLIQNKASLLMTATQKMLQSKGL